MILCAALLALAAWLIGAVADISAIMAMGIMTFVLGSAVILVSAFRARRSDTGLDPSATAMTLAVQAFGLALWVGPMVVLAGWMLLVIAAASLVLAFVPARCPG